MMKTVIKNALIVNENRCYRGIISIVDDIIDDIIEYGDDADIDSKVDEITRDADIVIDAEGGCVMPGVIDDHVHFRQPGLTDKADIDTESAAAAAGGVTSYFDMPNTVPQTTDIESLEDKFRMAAKSSHVNYSFFFGATNSNSHLFPLLDSHRIPGIKLFMGSSTGNMLVDNDDALDDIFSHTDMPIMVHCEDTDIISANMAKAKVLYGNDPDVTHHPEIRDRKCCMESSSRAVRLARKHGTQLHIAHVSTADELTLVDTPSQDDNDGMCRSESNITLEAVIGHLFFDDQDYQRLGTKIKVNPAIKSHDDRMALLKALAEGRISVVATDHAPHLLEQKEGGCARAASGMPIIQFSLPLMLSLTDEGVIDICRVVQLMSHNPARIFGLRQRGFLRKGYKADITIVRRQEWTLDESMILSKCKWSPLTGHQFSWMVTHTLCNGHIVYDQGRIDRTYVGEPLVFR